MNCKYVYGCQGNALLGGIDYKDAPEAQIMEMMRQICSPGELKQNYEVVNIFSYRNQI